MGLRRLKSRKTAATCVTPPRGQQRPGNLGKMRRRSIKAGDKGTLT